MTDRINIPGSMNVNWHKKNLLPLSDGAAYAPTGCTRLHAFRRIVNSWVAGYRLLQRQPQQDLHRTPKRTKNDVFCVVDNTCNAGWPTDTDDCGVWWISSAGHATQHPFARTADGRFWRITHICTVNTSLKLGGRYILVFQDGHPCGMLVDILFPLTRYAMLLQSARSVRFWKQTF